VNKTERIFKIEQLLALRQVVSFKALQEELEISRATLNRDLAYLRDRMKTPFEHDRSAGGYRRRKLTGKNVREGFPGLWFNASEATALLTMHHLLSTLQPGLLARHIEPLRERLEALMGSSEHSFADFERRVRIEQQGRAAPEPKYFQVVADAVFARRRLKLTYYARSSDAATTREISPQQLVFYRQNWYLDAWCHLREDLRKFALDGIRGLECLETPALELPQAELQEFLAAGYGIFAGRKTQWAKLRFSPSAARWVAAERWHTRQKSRMEADGSYWLEVPYTEEQELVMDLLRYGADVEVLEPAALRDRVKTALAAALARYGE